MQPRWASQKHPVLNVNVGRSTQILYFSKNTTVRKYCYKYVQHSWLKSLIPLSSNTDAMGLGMVAGPTYQPQSVSVSTPRNQHLTNALPRCTLFVLAYPIPNTVCLSVFPVCLSEKWVHLYLDGPKQSREKRVREKGRGKEYREGATWRDGGEAGQE